jgi:hypothetical protein
MRDGFAVGLDRHNTETSEGGRMSNVRTLMLATLAMFVAACASTPKTPPAPTSADLSGNWVLTTESQMGAQDSDMVVNQSGSAITGTLTSQLGSVDYTGSVEGQNVAFSFMFNAQGTDLKMDYAGIVEGDTMKGKAVFGSFGEGTFTAKRKN